MAARHQRAPRAPHAARRHPHGACLGGAGGHRGRKGRRVLLSLYRAFPWDPATAPGDRFSAEYVPTGQGSGRFDLPDIPVWYLSESPVHAVCEVLQGFRSRPFRPSMLRRFGHPLALVEVQLPDDVAPAIVDLDDPAELVRLGFTPGMLASDDRKRTQAIALEIHALGAPGLRWWSKLSGDWHAVVLFLDRVPVERLEIDLPALLGANDDIVVRACQHLAIRR